MFDTLLYGIIALYYLKKCVWCAGLSDHIAESYMNCIQKMVHIDSALQNGSVSVAEAVLAV